MKLFGEWSPFVEFQRSLFVFQIAGYNLIDAWLDSTHSLIIGSGILGIMESRLGINEKRWGEYIASMITRDNVYYHEVIERS